MSYSWWVHYGHGICPHCHEPSCIDVEYQWQFFPYYFAIIGYRCGSCDTSIGFEETRFFYSPCPEIVMSPYIANRKSKEVHIRGCVWASRIANHNRLECFPNGAIYLIKEREYNGCYYCLPEYDTDKHEVTQESMNEIYTRLSTIPTGIDFAKWESSEDVQGLMWRIQPNLLYFDANKPTIIWIHGWPDVYIKNYPNFLYADMFLRKGYNVAIYRWDRDILDIPKVKDVNLEMGAYVTTCNSCRKHVLDKVWNPGGSGDVFRNTLEEFFGQEKMQSYTKEITLLAHSTAAQLICLGLRSFDEEINPLETLKFRLVFVDPWFPSLTGTFYPTAWHATWDPHPYYKPSLAKTILSKVSDKGNPIVFIPSTGYVGVEAVRTLHGIESKATCVRIFPTKTATEHNYGQMRHATYPWQNDIYRIPHSAGVIHWYAIDWYCELIDSDPPLSNNGRNVPSPNLARIDIHKQTYYKQETGSNSYAPTDDTFTEKISLSWKDEETREDEEEEEGIYSDSDFGDNGWDD